MQTLEQILASLDSLDNGLTICAERCNGEWTPASKAWLCREDPESQEPAPDGYFLEVSMAKEVLNGWIRFQLKRRPTSQKMISRIIQYATNDA